MNRRMAMLAFIVLLAASTPARAQYGEYVPCGFYTGDWNNISHVVVAFSEGTAWVNEKWVWLTAFNPKSYDQTVTVVAHVDNYGPVGWEATIPSKQRMAWNMNVEIYNRTGRRGRVNFATEVAFTGESAGAPAQQSGVGVANIAVWDWNYSQIPVYLLGTTLCVVRNPF
jgi:hypothetical protein